KKIGHLLANIYAWFWGHEHKCIILGDHLGIKARCIGHAAMPESVPYRPRFEDVPIVQVDERRSPGGANVHGFPLLKFAGSRPDVYYIDEFGAEFFAERLDAGEAPATTVRRAETEGAERPAAQMTATHYKRVLKRRESLRAGLEGLEGAGDGEPDLSQAAIKD